MDVASKIGATGGELQVLMVCPQFKPVVGGYERAAERLAAELVDQGHQVTVVTERRDASWPLRENDGGVTIRRLRCIYRPRWHTVTALLSFLAFLVCNGRHYQIVHVHQYGTYLAIAVLLGRVIRVPVVLKLTNTGAQGIEKTLNDRGVIRSLLVATHRRVDVCFATTQSAVDEALRFGIPAGRVKLIPNGIDAGIFKPGTLTEKQELQQQLGLQAGLVVLFMGRLSAAKNPLGLLEAWCSMCNQFPSAKLVYVGPGLLRTELQEQATAIGCDDSVLLVGSSSDVLSWYRASDIFALPSHNEGLSNSLLEAISCGLPVVSTRVSGSEEIFAQADIGELVEVGNMPAFANGLSRLMRDSVRRAACGEAARDVARHYYSLHVVGQHTVEAYKHVLR